jgi:hypothetical protein
MAREHVHVMPIPTDVWPKPTAEAGPIEVTTGDKMFMVTVMFVFGVVPLLWLIYGALRDAWRARDRAWRLAAARAPKLPRARVLRR